MKRLVSKKQQPNNPINLKELRCGLMQGLLPLQANKLLLLYYNSLEIIYIRAFLIKKFPACITPIKPSYTEMVNF